MKATELRIGNYVHSGTDKKVCTIDGFDIMQMENDVEYDKIHTPISLTEQWMKDLGFEIKGDEDNIYEKNDISGGLYNVLDQYEFELTWYEYTPCKFVHQLQNLYFALTGEELELKTK